MNAGASIRSCVAVVAMSGMLAAFAPEADAADAVKYVCPPCGHDCLETTFDAPGACGECGMALITLEQALNQPAPQAPHGDADRPRVAVLLFDGVQIIDYTGPWEVFGGAGFEVFSVAKSTEPLETVYGMKVTPQYTLENHPEVDIVLVPGGQVFATQSDPTVRKWLNDMAGKVDVVMSVCNGAFILAKSGLLEGLEATTTRSLVGGLANAGKGITVVRNVRYVDTGKIITAGGLSAGMDAALHVVSRYAGDASAQALAQGLEYDWRDE